MNAARALLALFAALTLAACTSSGKGAAGTDGPAPNGAPTDAAGLSALVKSAVAKITSAHLDLDVSLGAQALTGEGAEKLDNGQLVGLDLTENLPGTGGSIRVIVIGGKTYAKLPSSLNKSSTPYLLVTPHSSNSIVRELAASLDSALSSASLGSVSTFVDAARSFEVKGAETVAGVATTHYSVVVEIAKLPDDLPGKAELAAGGVNTLPLELYIDAQGRPVQVTENLTLHGQPISTRSTVTAYNKPVTIAAPPADQVGS